jgi:hypothetical protein
MRLESQAPLRLTTFLGTGLIPRIHPSVDGESEARKNLLSQYACPRNNGFESEGVIRPIPKTSAQIMVGRPLRDGSVRTVPSLQGRCRYFKFQIGPDIDRLRQGFAHNKRSAQFVAGGLHKSIKLRICW